MEFSTVYYTILYYATYYTILYSFKWVSTYSRRPIDHIPRVIEGARGHVIAQCPEKGVAIAVRLNPTCQRGRTV